MPVISGGPYGFEHVNVAAQKRDPNSFMDWTERIIRMRKEIPEIGWGDFEILDTHAKEVLAIRYDWRNNSVLFVHNLSSIPREVEFSTGVKGGRPVGESAYRTITAGREIGETSGICWSRMGIAGIAWEGWITC